MLTQSDSLDFRVSTVREMGDGQAAQVHLISG